LPAIAPAAAAPVGAPPLLSAAGPELGTLSPAVSAGMAPPITTPLAAPTGAAAPGAEAITSGAETGFDTAGAGMTTTPESEGLWSTIKGYADSPYGQMAIKEGLGALKKPRSPFEPMQMQTPGLPAVAPSPSIDRLAWMRAFNVQG